MLKIVAENVLSKLGEIGAKNMCVNNFIDKLFVLKNADPAVKY